MHAARRARPGTALVTGASAGLGKVFAERLAARGYDLLLVARDEARLAALAGELAQRHGVRAEVLAADLSEAAAIDRVADRVRATPDLTLLVNNAGFGTQGRLAVADPARQRAMLAVHTLAPMVLTQAALPAMLAAGRGGVINMASVAAFVFSPGNANYCATKAYLVTFSEAVDAEVRGSGVRVQALCPGFTHTEFHQRMQSSKDDIPAWLWLDAGRVVEDSLRQLERGGPVICVPALRYKLLVALIRLVPRGLLGRVVGRRYERRSLRG